MKIKNIQFQTDQVVEFTGPINELTGAAIVSATSAKCRLFHDRKDTRLTATVSSGTTISVTDPGVYTPNGDRVVVELNDGTWHEGGVVTAVDEEAGTVQITNAIPSNTNKDHRVCCNLGNDIGSGTPWEIDMSYFEPASGAAAGNHDYGWRVTIPDSQAAFEIGIPVRIEMDLDFATNVRITEIIRTFIEGGM